MGICGGIMGYDGIVSIWQLNDLLWKTIKQVLRVIHHESSLMGIFHSYTVDSFLDVELCLSSLAQQFGYVQTCGIARYTPITPAFWNWKTKSSYYSVNLRVFPKCSDKPKYSGIGGYIRRHSHCITTAAVQPQISELLDGHAKAHKSGRWCPSSLIKLVCN